MNILVTGAAGFAGRNLVENLKNIRDGKNRARSGIRIEKIYEYDRHNTEEELDRFCSDCSFVFHLAGVNRPQNPKEFKEGNYGFASSLLETLKKHHNKASVLLSSSVQATCAGRFGTSEYGLSKRAGEELFFRYAKETGSKVYVYRFPNLTGKFVKPHYNSAVGTFCWSVANDQPFTVNDPDTELELLFIDDLIEEMYDVLEGHPHRCEYPKAGEVVEGMEYDGLSPRPVETGKYCYAPVTHKATLGYIVECLERFRKQTETLMIPDLTSNTLEYKLYSMYISYLPEEKAVYSLNMKCDERGSFTELLKTSNHGQVSVNITKPGVTKGLHWHNTKLEQFIVVAGHGLIQERKIGTDEIEEYEVSGEKIQAVIMKPGFTHSIKNISDTEDLVTVMWANEIFDPDRPDTFFEPVVLPEKQKG